MKLLSTNFAAALAALALACGGAQSGETSQPNTTGDSQITDGTQPPAAEVSVPEEAKGTPSDDVIDRNVFFGNPDRAGVQISPDGKHLSWLAASGGVLNVWVAPRANLAAAKAVTNDTVRPVTSYFWAYDNKHILYMQDKGGDENYRVYSVDIETAKQVDLTPMKGVRAQIMAVSRKTPNEIVVGINDRNPQLHDPYRINITTGEKTLLLTNPGLVGFEINDDYKIVLGQRQTPDGGMEFLTPPKAKKTTRQPPVKAKEAAKAEPAIKKTIPADPLADWKTWTKVGMEDAQSTGTITFDKSGKYVYMWDSRGRNTSALTKVSLKTGKGRVLAKSNKADGSGLMIHPTKKTILAVTFTHARREIKVLDSSVKRDLKKIKKINDGEVSVIDTTLDNNTWILAFFRDDGPVQYYIWDRKKQKEELLFSNRKALEGKKLAKMHDRIVKSRDGLELVNYLTLPVSTDSDGNGVPEAELPMVLLVHGGPWARDNWGYNAYHQFLANRGYAVMSVNFRGSTGLGKKFLNAGNKEWAGKMHDDLIDSVKWAVDNKIANKDKVCIMGGSYGGYATLVGLTMTPDEFACGIDIVGPSSILTLLEAIPPYWKPMQDLFKTRVGDWTSPEGKKALIAASPLTHVDKIKKPLLIAQGANDPRVKKAEADQIVAAMKAKGIPVSYVLFPDEGHGFRREPNKLVFNAAVEAFLSTHLGGVYQPAKPESFKGTTLKVPEGVYGIPGFPALTKSMK